MPQTRACDYCGADVEPGTGTMFVATDGTVTHFPEQKCVTVPSVATNIVPVPGSMSAPQ